MKYIFIKLFKSKKADASIHRLLLRRLALATTLIAALMSTVVIVNEQGRLGEVALERAHITAKYFNLSVGSLLDRPGGPAWNSLGQEMERYMMQTGRLDHGRFILVEFMDITGQSMITVVRNDHALIESVRESVASTKLDVLPEIDGFLVESIRIESSLYSQVVLPLTTSTGNIAAYIHGVFAVSDDTIKEIQSKLLRNIGIVIVLVFVTSALLYPTILKLLHRVTGLTESLLDANLTTIALLGGTIAKRDSDTDIHNYRVTIYSVRIAEAAGLEKPAIQSLIKGAFLHDVGKIGISDNILMKPGQLTENEFEEMKKHVHYGIDIIKHSTWLKDAVDVVGNHHEKYDGSGYHAGLRGDQIPLAARIFAIADVFDALTSRRPYKDPLSFETAMRLLEESRGRHFDPRLLDLFQCIAKQLYNEFGDRDDDHPRNVLAEIMERYFKQDFSALLNSHY